MVARARTGEVWATMAVSMLGLLWVGLGVYHLTTAMTIRGRPGVEELIRLKRWFDAPPEVLLGTLLLYLGWGLWTTRDWAVTRPVGVSVLAVVAGVGGAASMASGVFYIIMSGLLKDPVSPGLLLLLIGLGPLLLYVAWSAWVLKRWAWYWITALVGILALWQLMSLDLVHAAVAAGALYYLRRPEVKAAFRSGQPGAGSEGSSVQWRASLWKAYFVVLAALASAGAVLQGFTLWALIDDVLVAVALIGLFAFAWRRNILGAHVWKAFLPVLIVWNIAYLYFLPLSPAVARSGLVESDRPLQGTLTLVVIAPLFVALYRQGGSRG